MAFKDILGHQKPIRLLQQAIKTDTVVQSYLFFGNEGIGKKRVALQFSKALNCLNRGPDPADACDHCISCRKIDKGQHPDILILEPENQTIKVDQVRQMQRELAYRPYEGRRRVCIITAAERMAPNMSNILLKTLEEPPLHTVIVLLAPSRKYILPTILSRCRSIRFNPLPVPLTAQWLEKEKGLKAEEARLLSSLSEGSIGKALEFQEEIGSVPRVDLLEHWVGSRSPSFEEIENWTESLPTERGPLISFLELAKTLLRDLVILKTAGDPKKVIHFDLLERMEAVSAHWNVPALLSRMESLHRTILAVSPNTGNANTKLALEAMMLSWAEG